MLKLKNFLLLKFYVKSYRQSVSRNSILCSFRFTKLISCKIWVAEKCPKSQCGKTNFSLINKKFRQTSYYKILLENVGFTKFLWKSSETKLFPHCASKTIWRNAFKAEKTILCKTHFTENISINQNYFVH